MKKIAIILALSLSLISALSLLRAEDAKNRTWTDVSGRTVEAAFDGVDGTQVRLRLADGSVASVPMEKLSAADVEFIKSAMASMTPGGTAGPASASDATATAATGGSSLGGAVTALKEWPRSIDIGATPVPEIVREDSETKEFIYRSGHYEFHCDSKLTATVVREFSRIFEATYLLNASLPLDLKPSPEEGQEYFVAKLYTNRDDYMKDGGIEGSAGVYQRGKKMLCVPLASLGVKISGSRVLLEASGNKGDNTTLIHEITHQMMNHWLNKLRTWFIEGSAEVIEMIDYSRGKFSLSARKNQLREYLRGKSYTCLDLEELISLDGVTWRDAVSSSGSQARQNYHSAGLLVYYFYYLDGEGDAANVIAFFRELEGLEDKSGENAAFEKHLLRGRSIDQLKEDLVKTFRSEGIAISFDEPGKNTAN